MSEKLAKISFLAIGSNLGNKKRNIEITKFLLKKNNITIIKSSKNYESLSWPNKNYPKFINVVLKIKTTLSALELMEKCIDIEKHFGRKKTLKNEPRMCDIDIIDYDKKIILKKTNPNLIIPHPRMHRRNFVLIPLFEIAKSWIHPQKKVTIKNLINSLKSEELRAIKLI